MNARMKGSVCGIVAAVAYGTNPLGALSLYDMGVNTSSVLFYRYLLAVVMLAAVMIFRRESFRISARHLGALAVMGALFAVSSLSLFESFRYMDAGIASTLLFVYPVMVAVIMAVFFHEKITFVTIVAVILATVGIFMLYRGDGNASLDAFGVMLVMLSSLTYALYIIAVNKSVPGISSMKTTFYVLLFGVAVIAIHSMSGYGGKLQMLDTLPMWGYALMLALLPTVLSLVLMAISIRCIGSTPAALLGALEPVTAVVIGVFVFDERVTLRLAAGMFLVLLAVILTISARQIAGWRFSSAVDAVAGLIHAGGARLRHPFRWK